jgi:hypothetical protein
VDSSRLRTGEMVAGIGGIALFVFLFIDWFGAGFEGFDDGVSGWDGLGTDVTGFIVFLAAVAGPALALLAMAGQRLNVPAPRGAGTAALGMLTVAIIAWRIFANPGDLKVGLFLGLAAAVAIAVGALMALREDGIEALVAVRGGRTRTAGASAAAATPARSSSRGSKATRSKASGSRSKTSRSRTTSSRSRSGSSKSRSSKSSRSRSQTAKGSSRGGKK